MRKLSQSVATPIIASRNVASFADLIFVFSFLLSSLDPMSLSSPISYGVFSASWSRVLYLKVFMRASAPISLLLTTTSMRNGDNMTDFLEFQSQSFFYLSRLPASAQRRNLVFGRWIFLPLTEKERLMSIKTTVSAARDLSRAKAVTIFQGTCLQWTHAHTLPGFPRVCLFWWVLTNGVNQLVLSWILMQINFLSAWRLELNIYFGRKTCRGCVGVSI